MVSVSFVPETSLGQDTTDSGCNAGLVDDALAFAMKKATRTVRNTSVSASKCAASSCTAGILHVGVSRRDGSIGAAISTQLHRCRNVFFPFVLDRSAHHESRNEVDHAVSAHPLMLRGKALYVVPACVIALTWYCGLDI